MELEAGIAGFIPETNHASLYPLPDSACPLRARAFHEADFLFRQPVQFIHQFIYLPVQPLAPPLPILDVSVRQGTGEFLFSRQRLLPCPFPASVLTIMAGAGSWHFMVL